MIKKCKIIDCKNHVMNLDDGKIYGIYGYCQAHALNLIKLKRLNIDEKIKEKLNGR